MNNRIEKNRHHLATVVSLITALSAAGAILLFFPSQRRVLSLSLPFFLLILAGRTIMIEAGFRRHPSDASQTIETKTKEILKTKLGIQITDN